ncbi:MAG TPA: hypothetical protein VIA18_08370, partial [Polyangia bacterium]|nr:hypothetical protein [Polyangia bacterium]
VELANDRGGDDNITVVLIHVANDAASGGNGANGSGLGKVDAITAGGDGKHAAKADAKPHSDGKTDAKAHSDGKTEAKAHSDGKNDARAASEGKADAKAHGDGKSDMRAIGDAKPHGGDKSHASGKAADGKPGKAAGDGKPKGGRGKKGGGR